MLSIRLNRNTARNSGKHCLKITTMLSKVQRGDFGVSISPKGKVRKTNVNAATTAITTLATPTLRVISNASEKSSTTRTERTACEMPAR